MHVLRGVSVGESCGLRISRYTNPITESEGRVMETFGSIMRLEFLDVRVRDHCAGH
jgi:hypothetical protein